MAGLGHLEKVPGRRLHGLAAAVNPGAGCYAGNAASTRNPEESSLGRTASGKWYLLLGKLGGGEARQTAGRATSARAQGRPGSSSELRKSCRWSIMTGGSLETKFGPTEGRNVMSISHCRIAASLVCAIALFGGSLAASALADDAPAAPKKAPQLSPAQRAQIEVSARRQGRQSRR